MYIDNRGELQAETSSSIAGYEKAIFTDEVQDRFLKLANGEWQRNMQNSHSGKSRKKEKFKLCGVKEAGKAHFFPKQAWPCPTLLLPGTTQPSHGPLASFPANGSHSRISGTDAVCGALTRVPDPDGSPHLLVRLLSDQHSGSDRRSF